MSGPKTLPIDATGTDHYLPQLHATERSSISSKVDNSVNKSMPWIVLLAILSSFGLGVTIVGYWTLRDRVVDKEAQTALLEHYVTGLDSTLIAMGIRKEGQDFEQYRQQHLKRAQE